MGVGESALTCGESGVGVLRSKGSRARSTLIARVHITVSAPVRSPKAHMASSGGARGRYSDARLPVLPGKER